MLFELVSSIIASKRDDSRVVESWLRPGDRLYTERLPVVDERGAIECTYNGTTVEVYVSDVRRKARLIDGASSTASA